MAGILASSLSLRNTLARLHEDDAITLANTLNFGASALLAGGGGAALRSAYYARGRDRVRLAERSSSAGKALDGLAKRWNQYFVGLTAVAAFVQAVSDGWQGSEESGAARSIKFAGAGIQLGAAGVGGAHLLGLGWEPLVERLENFSSRSLARGAAGTSAKALTQMAVSRSAGYAAGGVARLATLGAGPVGWTLFALQSLYLVMANWHDGLVEEQRYTDWIACSLWGTGRRSTHLLGLLGGDELEPYADDEVQELRDFDRLWQKPTISTDVAWLKVLATGSRTAPLPWPEDARSISVLLPGWKPQVSWYEITQHHELDDMGVEQRLAGRDNVEAHPGYGILTFDTRTLMGNTRIKYYPNYEASPDFYLTHSDDTHDRAK